MKLPDKIRIGYRDFQVEVWDHLNAVSANRFGECDRNLGIIRVDVVSEPQNVCNTLLHEILHAVRHQQQLENDDHEQEERVVTVMANALSQVLRDNPGIHDIICFKTVGAKTEEEKFADFQKEVRRDAGITR